LSLEQISMREFVTATEGEPRFRAKFAPHNLLTRPSSGSSRQVGLFRISDGSQVFIIFNRFAAGDEWDPEAEDYTDAVWETAIFRSDETAEDAAIAVELLQDGDGPAVFAVAGALAYTKSVDGQAYEFLIELELAGASGGWRVTRSASPESFTLARYESVS